MNKGSEYVFLCEQIMKVIRTTYSYYIAAVCPIYQYFLPPWLHDCAAYFTAMSAFDTTVMLPPQYIFMNIKTGNVKGENDYYDIIIRNKANKTRAVSCHSFRQLTHTKSDRRVAFPCNVEFGFLFTPLFILVFFDHGENEFSSCLSFIISFWFLTEYCYTFMSFYL